MKPIKQITLYLIALFVTVSVCIKIITTNNIKTITDMSNKIDSLKIDCRTLTLKLDNVSKQTNNKILLDRLEQLTTDKIMLEQENNDLRTQIQEFGWWKK